MRGSFCFILLVFLQLACEEDRNVTKLQYMPDMAIGPVAKPYRSYVKPPEGSISYKAEIYEKTAEEAEKVRVNYLLAHADKKDQYLKEGKKLFGIYCTPCHGSDAKGDGSIVDKYVKPPDLTFDNYKKRGDGYFFHTISFGSDPVPGYGKDSAKIGKMPGYGYATSIDERWKIVMHLRKLQGLN